MTDPSAAPVVRCTHRTHLIDNGHEFCDCGSVIVGPTAAGNAKVVTLLGADRVPHTDEADEAPRGNDAIGV